MLSRARSSIGITDTEAASLHLEAYTEEVRDLLNIDNVSDAGACSLDVAAREKLSKLKGILQIDDSQAQRAVESETSPLYKACVAEVLQDCVEGDKSLSSLVGKLAIRQGELDLSGEAAEKALVGAIQSSMEDYFQQACQYSRVNNVEGTAEIVKSTLSFKGSVLDLLRKISTDIGDEGDSAIEATYFAGRLGGYDSVKERPLIYKQFLRSKLAANDNTLSEGDYNELETVKGMFGVPEMDSAMGFKEVVGPTLKGAMESATSDILDLPRSNDAIMELVLSLRIPQDTFNEFSMDLYRTRVRSAADAADGGLISAEQSTGIVALREFLELSESDVRPVIASALGPAFKASVKEAMGETGIIPDTYLDPLNQLWQRLLLTEDNATRIRNSAFADFLAPMCSDLAASMDKKPEDKKKDAGDLSALSNEEQFLEDCMAVLEFVKGNDIASKVEDGSEEVTEKKMVKKTEKQTVKKTVKKMIQEPTESGIMRNVEVEEEVSSEEDVEVEVEEEVTSTVTKYKYDFPITAQSVGGCGDEKATAVYKQFIVGSFQAKEPLVSKYSESYGDFGRVMGLNEKEINQIKGGIGASIFDNYFSNAMQDKVEMDQQDFMFLSQIQERLGFSDDIVERLLVSSQKNLLSKEVERLFSAGTKIAPSAIRACVEKAQGMEIDLALDLGVDDDRLGRMFSIQVQGGIEDGTITSDNGGETLGEIIEGLGLEEGNAERKLEALVADRAKRMVTNIASDVARGNDERAMKDLPIFLSYAKFVEGEGLGLGIAEAVREKIVGVYESATFGQTGSAEMVELLKKSLM